MSNVLRRRDAETDTPSREALWGQRHRLEERLRRKAPGCSRRQQPGRQEGSSWRGLREWLWISVFPPPEWERTDFFVPSPAVWSVALAVATPRCSCGGHARTGRAPLAHSSPEGQAGSLPPFPLRPGVVGSNQAGASGASSQTRQDLSSAAGCRPLSCRVRAHVSQCVPHPSPCML